MATQEYVYNEHLKELNESSFEMAAGEPDIRHWRVVAAPHLELGHVKELLFDEASRRVRYMIVDIEGKPLGLVSRSVILPMGLAELHRQDKLVVLPGLTVGHIASLPVYEKGKISNETERSIRTVFAPSAGISYRDEDYVERTPAYESETIRNEDVYRPRGEVVEKISLKEEMQENIEKVKESVRKMEREVEKLGKN